MGFSHSKNISEQKAEVYITQQFSGSCDVTCQNVMTNVTVDIINSTVGGSVSLSQSCATDASCMIGSNMDAIADVQFKATNTANAKNAWSGWSLDPFNFDTAVNESRQDMKEAINQSTSETCNISSYNQMNNITIFAANSTIGDNISITQNASTQGQCQLNNSMNAAAYASGIAQNTATSGKDKKGQKFGDKSSIMVGLTYLIIAIVVIVIVSVIAKVITGHAKKTAERKRVETAPILRRPVPPAPPTQTLS
uniref:Lipid membrane protein n=1 Tax=Marseillevirus LCMAC102 TaxID=2506603 RepID=A0A481YU04_9VIRU|nr:MAG: lipid membrane protein [Marseillevirus LCMAC102]